MKRFVALCLTLLTAMAASIASANFHLYVIEQLYSNADGTVQFVVLYSPTHGEDQWANRSIIASSGSQAHAFTFPAALPDALTAQRRVLVATQGFAALGIVTPDFVVPNGFLFLANGTVNFANVNQVTYDALPTDGVHSIDAYTGASIQNVARNFAGTSASVVPTGPPPQASLNFQGIWWNAPAESESGWGINFAHQGDFIFAAWYTYDANGRAWWLTMNAPKTGPNTYAGKLYENRGPPLNAFNKDLVTSAEVGDGTLTFADGEHGTFRYTVNGVTQTKPLVRFAFGAMPTCTWGAQTNLALATNYQDMWWASPGGAESGWGATLTHQGDIIFVAWFTYDLDGKPLWLTATIRKSAPGVYSGDVNRTTGPAFSATPWTPATPTKVGELTITFANGNHASFHYTLNLGGTAIDQTKTIERFVFLASGTACH